MTKVGFWVLGAALAGACLAGDTIFAQQGAAPKAKPAMAVSHAPEAMTPEAQNKLVGYYCTACHDDVSAFSSRNSSRRCRTRPPTMMTKRETLP